MGKSNTWLRRGRAVALAATALFLLQSVGLPTATAAPLPADPMASAATSSLSRLETTYSNYLKKQQTQVLTTYSTQAKRQLAAKGVNVAALTPNQLGSESITVFLTLTAKPAASRASTPAPTGSAHSIAAIQSAQDTVVHSQSSIVAQAEAITGTRVQRQFGYLVNGFSLQAKLSQLPKLAAIKGVAAVEPEQSYKLEDTSSNDMGQIPSIWSNRHLKGEGTVVAVIDSGIDYSHKDLRLSNPKAAKLTKTAAQATIKALGHGTWESDKVPYAFNYADADSAASGTKDTTGEMHGQHVSGIIAANGVNPDGLSSVEGVAPEAQLLDLKVFSNLQGGGATTDTILQALSDAVSLGADVINCSFGSDSGGADEAMDGVEIAAVNQAAAKGVIPVIAAGNAGLSSSLDDSRTSVYDTLDESMVGDPSVAADSLSVASVDNQQRVGTLYSMTMDLSHDGRPADASNTSQAVNGLNNLEFFGANDFDSAISSGQIVALPDQTGQAQPLNPGLGVGSTDAAGDPNSGDWQGVDVKGKIVVLSRGAINFSDKQSAAEENGAKAVIIVNNAPDLDEELDLTEESIPTLEITPATWQLLQQQLTAHGPGLAVNFTGWHHTYLPNLTGGQVSSFSSFGPTPNLDFKPEIAGVGGNIWSLTNASGPDKGGYQTMSGTSMATPFVSGVMALLSQSWKDQGVKLSGQDWTRAAKAAVINTAAPVKDTAHHSYYSPRQQGAGLIQADNALANTTTVTNTVNSSSPSATVALKQIGASTSFKLQLTNNGRRPVSYRLGDDGGPLHSLKDDSGTEYDAPLAGATLSFSQPTVTLQPGQSTALTVSLRLGPAVAKQQFVEGFIALTASDSESGLVPLSVPYVGFYGDYADLPAIEQPNSNPVLDGLGAGTAFYDQVTGFPLGLNLNPDQILQLMEDGQPTSQLVNDDAIAIAPRGTPGTQLTQAVLNIAFLRNVGNIQMNILDSKGKLVRELGKDSAFTKAYYDPAGQAFASDYDTVNGLWDGTVSDNVNGGSTLAPDGQYTYQVVATPAFAGAKPQTLDIPIKVDDTAPTFSNMRITKDAKGTASLSGTIKDSLSGFSQLTGLALLVNGGPTNPDGSMGQVYTLPGLSLDDALKAGRPLPVLHSENFSVKLSAAQAASLTKGTNTIEAVTADSAQNMGFYAADLPLNASSPDDGLILTNPTSADTDQSPYYDAATGTYELTGRYQQPFYVTADNGKTFTKVSPDPTSGDFTARVPVSTRMTAFTFTAQQDMGSVIGHEAFSFTKTPTGFAFDDAKSGIDPQTGILEIGYGQKPQATLYGTAAPGTSGVLLVMQDYSADSSSTTPPASVTKPATAVGTALPAAQLLSMPPVLAPVTTRPAVTGDDTGDGSGDGGDSAAPQPITVTPDPKTGDWSYQLPTPLPDGATLIQAAAYNLNANGVDQAFTQPIAALVFVDASTDFQFTNVTDNSEEPTLVGAATADWNSKDNTFTVRGKYDRSKVKNLVVYGWDSQADDARNQPTVHADGSFSVSVPLGLTQGKDGQASNDVSRHNNDLAVKYQYDEMGEDGSWSTVTSAFTLIVDTDFPSLQIRQGDNWQKSTTAGVDYDVYTNQDDFTITGTATDNLNGYSLAINQDRVFRQPGTDFNLQFLVPNHDTATFSRTYALDTSQPTTTGRFNLVLTDNIGNSTTRTIVVHRSTVKPAAPSLSENTTAPTHSASVTAKAADPADRLYCSVNYSDDGNDNNDNWQPCDSPIQLAANLTIYAKAVNRYGSSSAVTKLVVTNIINQVTLPPVTKPGATPGKGQTGTVTGTKAGGQASKTTTQRPQGLARTGSSGLGDTLVLGLGLLSGGLTLLLTRRRRPANR